MRKACCGPAAVLIVCLGLMAGPGTAFADDTPSDPHTVPFITGSVDAELQIDQSLKGPTNGAPETTFEVTTDYDFAVWFTRLLSLQTGLSVDSTDNRVSDQNLTTGDVGLRIEELYLQLAFGSLAVFGGKFDVGFGTAWNDAFGIYGPDLAEEYEFTEKLGAGARVLLGDGAGRHHELVGMLFFADTSRLSGDLINGRGRINIASGGVSNTGAPESLAVRLDGEAFLLPGDVTYSASFTAQARGKGDVRDLFGYAGSLRGEIPVGGGTTFEWMSEFAHVMNAEVTPGDSSYVTFSGRLDFGFLWLAPSITHRFETGAGTPAGSATLGTATIGYDFDSGISLSAGFRLFNEDGRTDELFGFKAEYSLDF